MTDKLYLITEAQLQELIEFSVFTSDSLAMLQSLPMVSGEPVAYRAWFDKDLGARWLFTLWPEEECLDVEWEPLFTHPTVSGEPAAYLKHHFIEVAFGTEPDVGFEVVDSNTVGAVPVYTSPQPLTPITAADVTYEMLELVHKHRLHSETEIIVAVFNSVAAHLVKHRSEAK